jgi:hypothetical protein
MMPVVMIIGLTIPVLLVLALSGRQSAKQAAVRVVAQRPRR